MTTTMTTDPYVYQCSACGYSYASPNELEEIMHLCPKTHSFIKLKRRMNK